RSSRGAKRQIPEGLVGRTLELLGCDVQLTIDNSQLSIVNCQCVGNRPMHEISVLYEDNHCLAVCKPAPLLTQGVPAGIPTLEGMVKEYLKAKYHKAGNVYLGIPHRLDRPVSGVVLFARNSKAASRLAEQFERRQVAKIYWGALEGEIASDEGMW